MIRKKKRATLPEKLSSQKCAQLTAEVCETPESHSAKNDYYAHRTVKETLKEIYGNKCAYCESDPAASSPARIDHFRPKKNVKNQDHPGYYWLTYEWTNLIQSCERCNLFKSNHFPLWKENTRVQPPPELKELGVPFPNWSNPNEFPLVDEKRLLLNPEWDDVDKHFYFTPEGKINPLTKEGKMSIDIYGLNRESLIFARKKKSKRYLNSINRFLQEFAKEKQKALAYEELSKKIDDLFFEILVEETNILEEQINREYSAYGFFMAMHFEDFYVKRCSDPPLLKEIYQKIQAKYQL